MGHNEIKENVHNLEESMARQNELLHDIKETLDGIRKMVNFFYVLAIVILVLWLLALIIYGPAIALSAIG